MMFFPPKYEDDSICSRKKLFLSLSFTMTTHVYYLHYCFVADRGDVQKGSAEIFFRKVKFWKEDGGEEAPPVFVCIYFFF